MKGKEGGEEGEKRGEEKMGPSWTREIGTLIYCLWGNKMVNPLWKTVW